MKNALLLTLTLALGCGSESSLPKMTDAGGDDLGHVHVPDTSLPQPSTSSDATLMADARAPVSPDASLSGAPDAKTATSDSSILVSETGKPLQPSPVLDAAPPRVEDASAPADVRMIASTDGLGPPVTIRTDAAGPRPLVYVDNLDSLGGASCPAEKSWVFPLELNSVYCGTIAEACRAVCKAAECRVANYIQGLQETYCLDRLPEP